MNPLKSSLRTLRLLRIRWREPILFEPALRRLHPAKQLPFGQACSAVLRSLPVRRQDVLCLNRRLRGWADLQTCRHADAGQNQCAYFHWLRLGTRENGLAEVLAGLKDLGNSPVRFVDRPKHQLTDGDRVTEADSRAQTGDQQ